MKVLLLQDIPQIGNRGEVKEVKEGYFKNFLLPKKMVKIVTPKLLSNLAEEKKKINAKAERGKYLAEELLKKIAGVSLQLTLKEGGTGQVFGSVTKQKIIEALKEKDVKIGKEHIKLGEPLKTFGFHDIKLDLGHGVTGIMRIEVIPEIEGLKTK